MQTKEFIIAEGQSLVASVLIMQDIKHVYNKETRLVNGLHGLQVVLDIPADCEVYDFINHDVETLVPGLYVQYQMPKGRKAQPETIEVPVAALEALIATALFHELAASGVDVAQVTVDIPTRHIGVAVNLPCPVEHIGFTVAL